MASKEELKNQITELKENCKKLAEEYRERYNQDNENKIALNMFYHNVISYNDYESVLALFENRNPMIMCFSAPPVLTEETVEINLKRIAELEAQIEKMKCCGNCRFSENDKLNGTFCHREGCFVVASAKCKLWEN